MRPLATIAATLVIVLWAVPVLAQAWVKPPGETYLKVTAGTFRANGSYNVEGEFEDPNLDYTNTSVGIYGELGIAPRLALSLQTSFNRAINTDDQTRYINAGPGDLALGLHTPLVGFGKCTSSASLSGRFPLYSGVLSPEADVTGSVNARFPALGDGSIDIMPGLSVGCGIAPIRGWVSLSTAYQLRLRGFGDGVTYSANIGSFVWPGRLATMLNVNGVQRFAGDAERPTKSYVSVGGGLLFRIWGPLALELTGAYIPTGAFVARGWSASAGVSYSGSLW